MANKLAPKIQAFNYQLVRLGIPPKALKRRQQNG